MSTSLQSFNVNDPESVRAALEAMAPAIVKLDAQATELKTEVISQPNANGEFPTPADGALWMAAIHNKRQHPLRAQDKPPLLTGWEHKATTDLAQIRAWAAEYPGCNFGSVADDGPIFETDSPEVRKRFQGQFSNTLTIQSS